MHHGNGPQNAQRQLQRSRSFTGSEGEEQQTNLPQSPATSFAPSASPSAPQSPSYQIQQFIMSRSPVAGQNVNITLQNVGSVASGNQQITLTPLPIPNPASPNFQFSPQQRRFEHGSPSYIQVTSPLPQQVQSQSPTQPSPVPVQSLPNVRAGTPGSGLGMCSQSPTRGFVDASLLVRQISLSPSNGGHFVYQEGSGIAQIAQGTTAQVQIPSSGAPATVRERRLSQPHSQTGGTIHHLGPQSPVASGANMQPLTSPGHITTTNLPPQISNIIQGQLMQQQQALQGQQLSRPIGFDRASGGLIAGVGGPPAFGMTSPPPPTSPSRAIMPQGLSNLPLTPTVSTGVKKQPKKLEEIPPATQEAAQMRKQCLDHHHKQMEILRETFKEYLIELFFLQHLQGNMMDFLAFKKKHCVPLQAYLRQNDLDLEEEEEEEQSEVINDEVKVVTGKDGQTGTPVAIATQLPPNVSAAFSSQQQPFQQTHTGTPVTGTVNTIEIEAFKRQQALTPADSSKRPRIEVGRHGMVFQHPGVASGVPLQQLMPTAQGGMPPTPQAVQLTGQKQSQQQYDPSKGPPVQNAASLHTPPPQLPGRLQPANVPITSLPAALQLSQQQPQIVESPAQPQIQVKTQPQNVPITSAPHSQLPTPLQQQVQPALHIQGQTPTQVSQPQTVTLTRPSADAAQTSQRLTANSLPLTSSIPPAALSGTAPLSSYPVQTNRTSPATNKSLSPIASKPPGLAVTTGPKTQSPAQTAAVLPQDSSQDKLAEQVKLENQIHQRIAELRKEGLWSLRRLPKLQEAPRPKSHWDYLLEEMQWMATDFAQERRWKLVTAKKMVRTVARYHEEKKLNEERARKEEQNKLRRIAASIAREIEYFWSNIEQVVEIKLQIEFQEKRKKALNLRKSSNKVEDEEETIEEQEAKEGNINHQTELSNLAKEAELPLEDLVKMYEGAFSENFHWPQHKPDNKEDTSEEELEDHTGDQESLQKEVVLIDSLLSIDQHKGVERTNAVKKYTKDITEVAAAAEALLPKGSARILTAVKYNTPSLLCGTLREYQKIGLDWLAKLYKKNLNGILADEAGLGKTVQVIAFFAHLASNEGNWGPHLVVVRSCNILKWELELKRWCPGLKILLYFGSQRELKAKRQEWMEPNSFNVCITSYKQLFKGNHAFVKMRWKYLVIDEMQQIKNMTEKHWEALFNLRSQHRLLLIDTPLHNTLMELWTMVHFLIPGISRSYLDFPVKAANEENQDYCHKLVIRLHRMIQPFILRRSKRDVEKQLTKKYEHVLKCRLSNRQKAMYEDVILQPGTQDALKSGHFVSVLYVLMQLQRICNHPDLINPRLSSSSYVSEALEYETASLVLKALERDLWEDTDMCLFDLIGVENKMTHYEAQVLPKQKVTRKLIEEIYSSPHHPARPNPVKLKPSRLFQPVQYGQKPEGRTVVFPSTQVQRTVTTATVTQQGQVRGRSPIATVSANQGKKGGEVVKIAHLASIASAQGRIAQPETPVTLQFQGNKFTLSHSQLRQLTAGQPLQLQGSVLQIVSAPGQQYLRPQGPVVMQTVSQAGTVQNALNALGNQHQAGVPTSTAVTQQGRCSVVSSTFFCHFFLAKESFEEKNRLLKERLDRIFSGNERRCSRAPVYGRDLLGICSLIGERKVPQHCSTGDNKWRWAGFVNCYLSLSASEGPSDPLQDLILTSDQQQESLKDVLNRTRCVLPAAVAAPPCLYVAKPPPSYSHKMKVFKHNLKEKATPYLHQLHQITTPCLLQFPDLRLVQYDSGKLEALAVLLQKLKAEGRRVLILSQMILMLDILELFLNFHFLTFVRIDEYANHEQRQELMKSFNRDKRIFCAILSSHSRSTGVNLVEADTVVFYDNDLNPVMDAKAQEWCDRIGRCKDIHIYRLVSGNSVEEKLLKNGTKDLIREVAAQGNDYSMAFLTQQTIQELFEVHSPMEDSGFRVKAEEFVVLSQEPSPAETISPKVARPFIEVISEMSYSVGVELKAAKKAWEFYHMKELKEKEEKMLWEEEEEELLTYTREDAYNKEYVYEGPDGQTEIMPLWTPPTPPQDDNDIYIDSVMCLMYDTNPIPESKLPPVYVRKERKRHKTDPSVAGRKKKQRHGEAVIPPRSLFDRATPGMLKMRREGKEQKKNILLKQQTQFAKPLPTLVKPAAEAGQDNPEWLISEDWALLQAVKQLLELPLNLAVMSPAHTPNWDLVSDVVNSCSRVYRSPKQCRNRYENVIIPREEGKTKNSRPLRTNQIYAQDEGATHTQLYTNHFEMMKMIVGKRSPPIKPLLGMNPFQKNPKHASVLAESGINYDKPLPPIQVASLRAERIAKEKKALAEQQRAQQQTGPQPQQQQQAGQQQTQQSAVQQAQAQPQPQTQAQVVQQPQAVVQTAVTSVANTAVLVRKGSLAASEAGTIKTAVTGTSIQTATVSGNVIVNTVAGVPAATFQPINKRLASPVIPGTLTTSGGTSSAQVVHTQQRTAAAPAASTELVTIASTQGVRAVTSVTASAVVTTNLTPVQTQARSLVTQVTPATPTVQLSGKTITPAQFQLLRQQQQQQATQVQVPQIQTQAQAQSPAQIKTVGKLSQEQLMKLQKQKLQLPQQQATQQQTQPGAQQQTTQVQVQQQQQTQQLTAVTAPRPGAVLTGTTVTNLQVARLTRVPASQLQAQGQIQAQTPQAAQVTLAKPPVVSVPAAVVSSAGVTTLPVTVAGISVAIGQPQKAAGQTVVAQPLHVQQLLKLKHHPTAQQQKAIQPQVAQGQATVQQKQTSQQQKVTYSTQPAIKTQFLTTPISQAQKPSGTQQVQAQIQVAKLPQVVQQQATVANIQQMVSVSQQAQPQTVTLSQTTAGQQQVQVIPATTATAQVVQQKLIQQQVVTTASPQIQAPGVQNPAQAPATSEAQNQQAKVQMRTPTVRLKAPTKPS
uniref:E1A-binding protein p400 n=1 Tax=Chelonoidis abingdonii TaxID=106734 RepID=A0A8C0HFG3_CHEAB